MFEKQPSALHSWTQPCLFTSKQETRERQKGMSNRSTREVTIGEPPVLFISGSDIPLPSPRRLPLIREQIAGAADSAETPRCPSPQTPPPAPPGGAEGASRPAERHSPGGIRYRCPSHLNWLLSMWRSSGSTPSPSQMAELLILSLRKEAHFSHLYLEPRSFGHDPKFMAIGEGRNVDRPVNRELRFSAQLSSPQRSGTALPLLQQPHRSVYRSPAPFFPHS
ncbi:hypothetical protein AMECASPLE_008119 [Ameca splendens]|uniref:Uncharacterized protein n=1 Tax=Ameca splendens TaxID=208324 RepID=A0ABV0XZU4_9TELE